MLHVLKSRMRSEVCNLNSNDTVLESNIRKNMFTPHEIIYHLYIFYHSLITFVTFLF